LKFFLRKGKGVKKTDIFLKRIETMNLRGYISSSLATSPIFFQLDSFWMKDFLVSHTVFDKI